MKLHILAIFISPVLFIYFTSCSKIEEPEFKSMKKVSIEKFGLGKSCIKTDLLFYNPNEFGVTLKEMNLDLFMNGSLMGHTDQNTDLKIGRKKDFTIPLKIEIDTKKTIKNVFSGILNGETDLSVKGKIKVSKAGISKSIPIDYTTTQKIDLF